MSGVSRASNAVADARFAQAASLTARPTGSYTTPWGESPLLRQLNISAAQDRAAAVAVCAIASTSTVIWSRDLPEPEGIQSLTADNGQVYVVYSELGAGLDSPPIGGHVAALDTGSGRVAWRAPRASRAPPRPFRNECRVPALPARPDPVPWRP